MVTEKGKEPVHETHLGVDAWSETSEKEESHEGFSSAARILAGEEPTDSSDE